MNEKLPEDPTAEGAPVETTTSDGTAPAAEARWPQIPAADGQLYSFADPRRPEERMVGMTLATWMQLKESMDDMTDKLRSAQSANIELAMKYQNLMEQKTRKQIILTPARGMKPPEPN